MSRTAATGLLAATTLLVGCGSSAAGGARPEAVSTTVVGSTTTALAAGATATPAPTMAPTSAPTTGPAAEADTVTVEEFAFAPPVVTVKAATKVTWTNRDAFAHSVLVKGGTIAEARMDAGASTSITFASAGTYAYVCGIHNSMSGTVVVTA